MISWGTKVPDDFVTPMYDSMIPGNYNIIALPIYLCYITVVCSIFYTKMLSGYKVCQILVSSGILTPLIFFHLY